MTAIKNAKIIILAVRPHDANTVLKEIGSHLKKGQIFVSIVTGLEINDLQKQIKKGVPIIRAMPNTALKVYQSMTCLVPSKDVVNEDMNEIQALFNHLGTTAIIREDQMSSATALCACGVAFFMRAIRAASQGGVEVGFHADFAINLVAQTALGASALVLNGEHPEYEVDQVTTPEGCTIAGLNEMEHSGLSSAFIKGIVTSAKKAKTLYSNNSSAKK